jgi:hypothetical protein
MSKPLTPPRLQVNVELKLIHSFDKDTKMHIVHFEGFPQATAYDPDRRVAALHLIELFKVMLNDHKAEVVAELLKNQLDIHHLPNLDIDMVTA